MSLFPLLVLIAQLGHDRYQAREEAHRKLQALVLELDDSRPAFLGLKFKDLEIRSRCFRILKEYSNLPIPEGLSLGAFDSTFDAAVMHKTSAYDQERDNYPKYWETRHLKYVYLLFQAGHSRRAVQKEINRARVKVFFETLSDWKRGLLGTPAALFPWLPGLPPPYYVPEVMIP